MTPREFSPTVIPSSTAPEAAPVSSPSIFTPSRILSASPRAPYQMSRAPRMHRCPSWGSSQRAHLAVQNPNHPRHSQMKHHIVLLVVSVDNPDPGPPLLREVVMVSMSMSYTTES
ncbi:hypothetical protein JB92DRAFT_2856892 [Gautieria morchelliformis]|nr:hypothetical protein JB92DRAFT_2856892 [Gautieria morchelliformis]